MEIPEFLVAVFAILSIFVGLPWIILHYLTKWKQAPRITVEDEQLLDDMFNLARRLEERLVTVERIAAAGSSRVQAGPDRADHHRLAARRRHANLFTRSEELTCLRAARNSTSTRNTAR